MDPDNTPFNALIVGPINSGKTQFLVNQLCGPFNGKFDYVVQIFRLQQNAVPFWCERSAVGCNHLRAAPGRNLAKIGQFLFRRHQHSHCSWWLRRLKRGQRTDWGAGQARLLGAPRRHQCVNVDTTALKHLEAFPWKRGSNSSFLHAIIKNNRPSLKNMPANFPMTK